MKNIYRRLCGGFTLIELMIVVFIMGLFATEVILRTGNPHNYHEMHAFSEFLEAQMKLMREQSMLQMTVLGLQINEVGYEFYQYNEKIQAWSPLKEKDSFWRLYPVPSDIKLDLITEYSKNNSSIISKNPQIIFLPSGEVTAFVIMIYKRNIPQRLQITSNSNGDIMLQEITK
jgi:general secretion pathway protein H